jgi:hypothetical protein
MQLYRIKKLDSYNVKLLRQCLLIIPFKESVCFLRSVLTKFLKDPVTIEFLKIPNIPLE